MSCDTTTEPLTPPTLTYPSHLPTVPSRRQVGDWDCGLACVYSILAYFGCEGLLYSHLRSVVSSLERRIWTIDLFYLLRSYNLASIEFYSIQLGVDRRHHEKPFYEEIERDEARIEALFGEVNKLKDTYRIYQRHLSLVDLLAFLADGDFLVVLCDQRKIRCQACHKLSETASTSLAVGGAGTSDLSSSLSSSSSSSHSEDGFLGHYILICGVDLASNIVYYLDPNIRSHSSYCLMSSVDFDRARLSDGTDEDVIRIRAKAMKGAVKVEPIGSPAFGFERIERKKKTQQTKTTTE